MSLSTEGSITRDAIVVLGQSLNPDGSAPNTLVLRAERAACLHRDLGGCPVIPTGGDPARTGTTEAAIMKRQLANLGVDPAAIHVEDRATNTCHNAALVLPILRRLGRRGRVLVVTSDFHMPRALYLFEAVFSHYGSADTVFVPSIADSGCPAARVPGAGVNGLTLRDRLEDERRYCSQEMLCMFLSRHIPGVKVPMLSHTRGQEARDQLDMMISLEEGLP